MFNKESERYLSDDHRKNGDQAFESAFSNQGPEFESAFQDYGKFAISFIMEGLFSDYFAGEHSI